VKPAIFTTSGPKSRSKRSTSQLSKPKNLRWKVNGGKVQLSCKTWMMMTTERWIYNEPQMHLNPKNSNKDVGKLELRKGKEKKNKKNNNAVMGKCDKPPVLFKVIELPAPCGKIKKNMERRIVA